VLNSIAGIIRNVKSGLGRSVALGAFAGALALALGISGCAATADVGAGVVYDYPTYSATVVPADIYDYPRVYYGDGYAYLVDGQWYYQSPSGWVIFREEPPALAERRVYIYRRHPPRVRYYEQRPGYYEARPPRRRPPPPPPQEPIERGRRYYPK
jgi:hypothetical protein